MAPPNNIIASTVDNGRVVFDQFKKHVSGTRVETRQLVLNLLRQAYPDHHVTAVDGNSCSLLEFASAGKASVDADTEGEIFNMERNWVPVGTGVEKKTHPGKLEDNHDFARFSYTWESNNFIVYRLVYHDMMAPTTRVFYVLHARGTGSNIEDGHCTKTDALILAAGKWTSMLHDEIWVYDNGYWEKSKDLFKAVAGSSWSDVILEPDMKDHLIQDVQGFFDNQELYRHYAVPWKRGIILHGVPGNGKTVSIKALINSLYARPDQIPTLYVKSFETNCNTKQYCIQEIFEQARDCAPCLLIFEDLDSLVDDNVRSYFLNEVDGLESNDGILMIGSTNHLDRLDPAISKRPSRFDRKYHFKLPGEKERILYAQYWREKLISRNDKLEFPEELCKVIAKLSEGFSFAYLKELFVMSLLSLVRGFKPDDFEIVDSAEADSAPGEEVSSSTPSSASTDKAKEDVCTCATKCSTCGKPIPDAEEKEEKDKNTTKTKHTIPTVDVPKQLTDNLLLKVIKHQIRVLVAEMDNTETEEWRSGKDEENDAEEDYAMQLKLLEKQNAARNARR